MALVVRTNGIHYITSVLRPLVGNLVKMVEGKVTPECTDGWWQVCYGLPCPHEIQRCVETNTPIMPAQIHTFWKKLAWERLPDHDDPDDCIPMDPTQVNLRHLATLINPE